MKTNFVKAAFTDEELEAVKLLSKIECNEQLKCEDCPCQAKYWPKGYSCIKNLSKEILKQCQKHMLME